MPPVLGLLEPLPRPTHACFVAQGVVHIYKIFGFPTADQPFPYIARKVDIWAR